MFDFIARLLCGRRIGINNPPKTPPPPPPKGQTIVEPLKCGIQCRCGVNEVPTKEKPINHPKGQKS